METRRQLLVMAQDAACVFAENTARRSFMSLTIRDDESTYF